MIDLLSRRREMMAQASQDDGLFAYWDGEDAKVDKKWVDRINGLKIAFLGAAVQDGNVYVFAGNAQGGYLEDPIDSYLQYELCCELECDFNVAAQQSNVGANMIGFGSYGTCVWDYGFLCGYQSNGAIRINPKNKNNQAQAKTEVTTTAYSDNTWVNGNKVVCGIRLVGDEQQVYASINGSQESTSANLTKMQLTPRGPNNQGRYFEIGGKGYSLANNLTIKIKSIKLYNK